MPSFRGFVAVEIPASEALAELRSALIASGGDLKVVASENVHLTVRFLGEVDESKVDSIVAGIAESVRGVSPFRARLVGTGAFPSPRNPRVFWVALEGAQPLMEIAKRLEDRIRAIGFPGEDRPFSAHVTLARTRSPRGAKEAADVLDRFAKRDFGEVDVRDLRLMKSDLTPQGPHYSVVKAVTFGGRDG